jgi:sugar phosphate isomerase/epimerase
MPPPIALQLYTVRDALARDFAGTLERIARMGYVGVETAGFPAGQTPAAAKRLFDDLGLTVCGAHSDLPLGDRRTRVLEDLAALGCQRLVCPWQPPDSFHSPADIQRVCALLNEAHTVARAHGLRLGYHNHWWEFESLAGNTAHALMRSHLAPEVFFELDLYWIKVAGLDPASVLREVGPRAPLLHIKDGPAVKEAPMTAVGTGVLDYPAHLAASSAEWLIVELDHCATEMLTAVEQSYHYLIDKGLAHGNR